MSRALSLDLRVRVLAAVAAGLSHRAAAARFGVSAASISRWRRRARLEGDPGPRAAGGDRRSGRIETHRGLVLDLVAQTPDITIEELRRLLAGRGLGFGYGTVQRFLVRHGMTRKKKKWDGRLPPLMFEVWGDEWTLAGRRHQSAKGRRASSSRANRREWNGRLPPPMFEA